MQKGYSLIELMVATGMAMVLAFFTSMLSVNIFKWHKTVSEKHRVENLRAVVRPLLACGLKCSEVSDKLPLKILHYDIRVRCDDWYDNYEILYSDNRPDKNNEFKSLFTSLGENLCHARQRGCQESCHNRGVMLGRGYFFPPLGEDVEDFVKSKGPGTCPGDDKVIGIDFGMQRAICGKPESLIGSGSASLCVEVKEIDRLTKEVDIGIGGDQICIEHSKVFTRKANLNHTKLDINLSFDYVPGESDQFLILHSSEPIVGKFANAKRFYYSSRGSFFVRYEPHKVFLESYMEKEKAH